MYKNKIRAILKMDISAEEAIKKIREIVDPPHNRLDFIRERYVYDSITGLIFNKKTGNSVTGTTVYTGERKSPVTLKRAKWFLTMGDDPLEVHSDRGGLYAIYEEGGVAVRAS